MRAGRPERRHGLADCHVLARRRGVHVAGVCDFAARGGGCAVDFAVGKRFEFLEEAEISIMSAPLKIGVRKMGVLTGMKNLEARV